MEKITFCIPSKSNVRYLKTCIPSIRDNAHRKDHDVIVFVDSDEDGTVDWLEQVKDQYSVKYYVNPKLNKELFGIGMAYDYCIDKSETEVFMVFHADMMLGKDADLNAWKMLKDRTVVCSTRVEPPIHPNGGEKILLDFGMWPEEFKREEFDSFVTSNLSEEKVTNGVFAPWMMRKKDFSAIGGHDPIMHSCREDSDVFNRMKLAGYQFVQPWNSLVYHLTGRGAGSFSGDADRHERWKRDMDKSTFEFLRKWGGTVKHTPLMEPLVSPVYDIGFRIKNCPEQSVKVMEPWCSTLYVELTQSQIESFVASEQPNTRFDLRKRVKAYNEERRNDIVVEFDLRRMNQEYFDLLQKIPDIIEQSGEEGIFELGPFSIDIRRMIDRRSELVRVDSEWHSKRLLQ